MNNIKRLKVHHMLTMMVLKDNNFDPYNAGLDLNTDGSNVHRITKQIDSYFPYPIFLRGNRRNYLKGNAVVGFTKEGQELYFSVKTFVESIMLIGKDNENKDN